MLLEIALIVFWCSPIAYLSMTIFGKIFHHRKRKELLCSSSNPHLRKIELIIFQIPTIENVATINEIFKAVRNYNLPYKLECWVIIEHFDKYKEKYNADRVIVVPEDFECDALYKARALEYARRLRIGMVKEKRLTDKYVVLQSDDDALPSKEFILDSLGVNADITIGSICPRPKSFWNTILDYERCVACTIWCNLFTNINKPVWGHGEGMTISSEVDRNIGYEARDFCKDHSVKLISSEDMFYLHKTSIKKYTCYKSEKPIFITPPLTLSDAIKQRRRWLWGHIRIFKHKLLPRANRIRIIAAEISGLLVYSIATFGIPLPLLGIVHLPAWILPLLWTTLIIWFILRFYGVAKLMGWKHGFAAMLASYITVTLNFFVHLIGLIKGDPKSFEVIKKSL